MNYADIKRIDIANGTGVRVSLFVSGCTHCCKDCFNQEAWDFKYGNEYTEETEKQILEYLKPKYIAGLSLLGGDPLEIQNQETVLKLVKKVKQTYPEKTIWCYTGCTLDKDILEGKYAENEVTQELIKYIDVMVDGEFERDLKDKTLKFRGSKNQRIIDVQESLKEKKVVEYSI